MKKTYSGTERRTNKRMRVNCTVIYRTNQPVDARFALQGEDIHAKMLNISQNGMAIITERDIPIFTVLAMRFTLLKVDVKLVKFSGPMDITGEVRSNESLPGNKHRLGIYFTKMKKVDLN